MSVTELQLPLADTAELFKYTASAKMKNSIQDSFTEILCSTTNGRDKYVCVYIQTLNGSFIRMGTYKISRDPS